MRFRAPLLASLLVILAGGLTVRQAHSHCGDYISPACQSSPNTWYADCDCDCHDGDNCGCIGPAQYVCVVSHCTTDSVNCQMGGGFETDCVDQANINVNYCPCSGSECS